MTFLRRVEPVHPYQCIHLCNTTLPPHIVWLMPSCDIRRVDETDCRVAINACNLLYFKGVRSTGYSKVILI